MSALEHLVERVDWRMRLASVGWDLCVLALGVAGGVFSNPRVIGTASAEQVVVAGIFSVAISLGATVAIAFIRREKAVTGWGATISLALGGTALSFPAYWGLGR